MKRGGKSRSNKMNGGNALVNIGTPLLLASGLYALSKKSKHGRKKNRTVRKNTKRTRRTRRTRSTRRARGKK